MNDETETTEMAPTEMMVATKPAKKKAKAPKKKAKAPKKKARKVSKARKAPTAAPREGSKKAQLISLVHRAKGASLAEIGEAFGWQPHTVRSAIVGLRKIGVDIGSERDEKRGRVYRAA